MTDHSLPLSLIVSGPQDPINLAPVLGAAYDADGVSWRARMGFAYISESGVDALLASAHSIPSWTQTEKKWVCGIHQAVTEPSAIERLVTLQNSSVRVFVPGGSLNANALVTAPRFHAKVMSLDCSGTPRLLLAGSANLTSAAFGLTPRNYEAGIVLHSSLITRPLASAFDHWWSEVWAKSVAATSEIIDSYARLRAQYLKRNPDLLASLEPPSIQQVRSASLLWIEAGKMSGGSRNQVEFSRELVPFFGEPLSTQRVLRVKCGQEIWDDRSLSPKVTTFGVEIWRLSLPTERQCGVNYPDRVIRLQKQEDDDGPFFVLRVADADSTLHRRWLRQSNRSGYVGMTSGNRAYGFA